MQNTDWHVRGDYFETCSCDYVCPCVPTQLTVRPTKGECIFAMAYHINQGHYGNVNLDGHTFVIVARTPEAMAHGNWEVGLIVDDQATAEQQQAITAIASGQAGGPIAALAPLIGTFHGVVTGPITFEGNGMNWRISIPGMLDQSIAGASGISNPPRPLFLDNTGHPAADRFGLANAVHSHIHTFGINWDDTSGKNNGQYAPFNWQSH